MEIGGEDKGRRGRVCRTGDVDSSHHKIRRLETHNIVDGGTRLGLEVGGPAHGDVERRAGACARHCVAESGVAERDGGGRVESDAARGGRLLQRSRVREAGIGERVCVWMGWDSSRPKKNADEDVWILSRGRTVGLADVEANVGCPYRRRPMSTTRVERVARNEVTSDEWGVRGAWPRGRFTSSSTRVCATAASTENATCNEATRQGRRLE